MVLSVVPPNPRNGHLLEAKKSVPIQLTTDEYDSPIIPVEIGYGDRKEPLPDDSDHHNGDLRSNGTNGTNDTNGHDNSTNGNGVHS